MHQHHKYGNMSQSGPQMGAKLWAIYNLALPCCTVCFWCCVLYAFYGHRHYRRVRIAIILYVVLKREATWVMVSWWLFLKSWDGWVFGLSY